MPDIECIQSRPSFGSVCAEVVVTRSAFLQAPLTLDYNAVQPHRIVAKSSRPPLIETNALFTDAFSRKPLCDQTKSDGFHKAIDSSFSLLGILQTYVMGARRKRSDRRCSAVLLRSAAYMEISCFSCSRNNKTTLWLTLPNLLIFRPAIC